MREYYFIHGLGSEQPTGQYSVLFRPYQGSEFQEGDTEGIIDCLESQGCEDVEYVEEIEIEDLPHRRFHVTMTRDAHDNVLRPSTWDDGCAPVSVDPLEPTNVDPPEDRGIYGTADGRYFL